MLTDQVAIVTGAGRGLGRATAEMLTRFGARVAVCDRIEDGLESISAEIAQPLDVRDAAATEAFIEHVVAVCGQIDVLVNNAGGTFFAPFLSVSDNGEEMLWLENFGHVTRLIRRVTPHMRPGGAIVNITSIEAHQASPGFAVYGAMKAALAQLTRTLALELASRDIRVNAIAPDAIPTGGDEDARAAMLDAGAEFDPAYEPPLGRMGEPVDVAAAAVFLAGPMARFITGTTLHVDGGNFAAGGWRRSPNDR